MTKAKIEPGKTNISLAGKPKARGSARSRTNEEKDVLPELGLKSPAKTKKTQAAATPLDPQIDLGED